MKLISILTLVFVVLGLTACAKDDIFEAKKIQIQAAKAGFEWRDMDKMIKKAEKEFLEGDSDIASEIALAVIKQGKMAIKQAENAKNAGPTF
jgi:uncharacterized protein YabN with tetrapyrrole methylase and pyrophosphatase domain